MSIGTFIQESGLKDLLPDKLFLAIKFRMHMGYWMSFRNPETFNEKLQWLKLHDRRPEYSTMVDKYAVKKYVADIIGEEYIIPTLGVWERGEDIDWDMLPDRFVLKCTHDSGDLIICEDKSKLDKAATIEKLDKGLKVNYFYHGREWPYKSVPRRIIAERYIEGEGDGLAEYKFFCFDGEVKVLYVVTGRSTEDVRFDFYDPDFKHLDIKNYNYYDIVQEKSLSAPDLPKPDNLDLMRQLAEKLSKGIPHVRVDLYNAGGKIYFGEMTFYHSCGIVPFHPAEWDHTLGSWLTLPSK